VAKYRAKPAGDRNDSYLDLVKQLGSECDAMRLALEATLQTQSLLFEFQVQLRTTDETMPIEDATVEWPESESPYRTVAHLLLRVRTSLCSLASCLPESGVQRLACARRTPPLGRHQPRPPLCLPHLVRLASPTRIGDIGKAAAGLTPTPRPTACRQETSAADLERIG